MSVTMRCPKCGNENRPEARFCDSCGNPLPRQAEQAVTAGGNGAAGIGPSALAQDGGGVIGPPSVPVRVAGRYLVGEFLGRGGRKDVFRARDEVTGNDVALALYDMEGVGEAARARARREAAAMKQLGAHPHVVSVLDAGEADGRPYVVSTYMPGGDVSSLLAEAPGGRLSPKQAIDIAIDLCRALEHAHAHGIVHRDLKPANVWLGDDGSAYLGDFGLATTGQPRGGVLVGTVAYLPPEQALGRPAGPAADLYSLGAMLYEMLTGRPPFTGSDAVTIISQHLSTDPVPPSRLNPEIGRELDSLVLDLLAKDPEARPDSAVAVRLRLEEARDAPPPDPDPTPPPDGNLLAGLAGGVFVGREQEVAEMRKVVEDALEGNGRLLLISGEPGIGKTRISEELATYARLNGASVHWGWCHEGDGAPAYWPWAQAIRSYVREADPVALAWELGTGVDEIARVVPEAAERIGAPLPEAGVEDEQDRFRLFQAIGNFLANAAASRPLTIVLDDLHWADEPSLLLLRYLSAELWRSPLLIIGTYRDVEVGRHHPLSRVLADLITEERTWRVNLRGLRPEDVARYVELTVGPGVSDEVIRSVYEQTEGNPFYMAEVVRLMAAEGSFFDPSAARRSIPQGVRDVIGRRLNRLSPKANEALRVAAVIGRDFDREALLAAIDGDDKEWVDEALAEAVSARLMSEPAPGRFRFSHPLVRETLYEEIGPSRRPAIHARIAAALERLFSSEPERLERRLAQIAYHYSMALAAGDPEKAVEYSERAGRQAISRLGYEEGAEHLARAIEALDLAKPDPERRCSLMLQLGRAQIQAGHPGEGRQTLEKTAQLARELGDQERLARAALGVARTIEAGTADREAAELLELALEGTPEGDSITRALLTSALAEQQYWVDPQGRSAELHREAVEMARRLGDEATLARTLSRANSVDLAPDSARRGIAINTEIIELARSAGDGELELGAYLMRLREHLTLGDVVDADRDLEAYERLAGELRQPRHLWQVPLVRATRMMIEGRLDEAERFAVEAREAGERAGEPLAQQFYVLQCCLIYRWQDRLVEIAGSVFDKAARYPAVPLWQVVEALVHYELGDVEQARTRFDRIAEGDFAGLPLDEQWGAAVAMLCELAFRLGDGTRAEILHGMLEPYSGQTVVAGRAATCWGPVDRCLGLASAAAGRLDRAVSELEAATEHAQQMGDRPFLAECGMNLSRVLSRRDRYGDRAWALKLVDRTLRAAQEMEMRGITRRALQLKLEIQGLAGHNLATSIDEMVSAVRSEQPDIRAYAAPDGTVTILFSDIEDSSIMIERLGDSRWLELLRRHNRIFRRQVRRHGGYEVKNQGDGFMLAFADPAAALRCAIAVQREIEGVGGGEGVGVVGAARVGESGGTRPGRTPRAGAGVAAPTEATERIRVRMGLHCGETIAVGGDFFGRNVVVAARIAGQARGGEILASGALTSRVEESEEFGFGPAREIELKGLTGTHTVRPVRWRADREVRD